ncbi:MAG: glycosyltransferase family 4 protein [Methylophilaceae bacterium]|nr:glycosyltransferase family 4 protein [Methylophilaceae bacterium]
MPKKILIVTGCFYPEEFKINDIALSWKKKGHDVDVLTMNPTYPLGKVSAGYKNRFFWKDHYKGINIFRLWTVTGYKDSAIKKIFKYMSFMFFGSIVAIFIGRRYDCVFGFNLGSLTDMFPAIVVRKLYKKPIMFWIQDIWPDSVYAYGFKKTWILSTFLDAFVKFMHSDIQAIAITCKGFESKLKPYIKKDLKFTYAPNWADDLDMDMDPAALSLTQKVHFTFAGNVGKVQNLDNIIKSFCMLSGEYKKRSQLNIIGEGSNINYLKKLAKGNSNIIFHGKKIRQDMAKFYKASDFLIVSLINKPIFSITIPAKTQTYIAAKKPILAIINGDVADIVKNYNLGVCADPSNLILIKETFRKCVDMTEKEKSKFTTNNTKLLKTIFNKNSIINRLTSQLIGHID